MKHYESDLAHTQGEKYKHISKLEYNVCLSW